MASFLPLTQEQLKQFPKEFSLFLASLGIDRPQWEKIKVDDSSRLEEIIEAFSAVVWTEILNQAQHLELFMADALALYFCDQDEIHLIFVRAPELDWESPKILDEIVQAIEKPATDIRVGKKNYGDSRTQELYSLLQKGAVVTDGNLYRALKTLLESKSAS